MIMLHSQNSLHYPKYGLILIIKITNYFLSPQFFFSNFILTENSFSRTSCRDNEVAK